MSCGCGGVFPFTRLLVFLGVCGWMAKYIFDVCCLADDYWVVVVASWVGGGGFPSLVSVVGMFLTVGVSCLCNVFGTSV